MPTTKRLRYLEQRSALECHSDALESPETNERLANVPEERGTP